MLLEDYIQIILFTTLCICCIFYLFLGIYSYKRDNKSKGNVIFYILCISTSLWAIGYALMLIAPNIEIANIWRIVATLGWYSYGGIWLSFAFYFKDMNQKKSSPKINYLVYIILIILFLNALISEPSKIVGIESYGFVDNLYGNTTIGMISAIFIAALFVIGFVIIYFQIKNSHKNRIRKQMKIIFTTCLISFFLIIISDVTLPSLGIMLFPFGIIALSIGMSGMSYAINRHNMMSISYELVSEYLFEAVNEPIFILGEDFLIKSCNEAALNINGYNNKDLKHSSLDVIIDFRDFNFNFNTMIQIGSATNIEVDLHRKNKEALVCELSATVIYDEYKDILGIFVVLHDVSERKKIAEIQKKYTSKLEESNLKLKNEIKDRLFAEEQIRHLVYYDALTELSNRKKLLEDVNMLLDNKREKFAILFMDLDKFKSANDTYGHEAGDYILKTVAVRLKSIIRSTDEVYRIGGDEFIIILRNLKASANAEKIAVVALETLSVAFTYKGNQLFVGACIGISIFPEHGIDADTLIKQADSAMYEVKRNGGNGYKYYSS